MKKHMSFNDRSFAALYVVGSQPDGISVREIAAFLEVSKVYAAKLIRHWVKAGLVTETTIPYRKNTGMTIFSMSNDQWIKYQTKGYAGIARDHYKGNLRLNYYRAIARIDSVMFPQSEV